MTGPWKTVDSASKHRPEGKSLRRRWWPTETVRFFSGSSTAAWWKVFLDFTARRRSAATLCFALPVLHNGKLDWWLAARAGKSHSFTSTPESLITSIASRVSNLGMCGMSMAGKIYVSNLYRKVSFYVRIYPYHVEVQANEAELWQTVWKRKTKNAKVFWTLAFFLYLNLASPNG